MFASEQNLDWQTSIIYLLKSACIQFFNVQFVKREDFQTFPNFVHTRALNMELGKHHVSFCTFGSNPYFFCRPYHCKWPGCGFAFDLRHPALSHLRKHLGSGASQTKLYEWLEVRAEQLDEQLLRQHVCHECGFFGKNPFTVTEKELFRCLWLGCQFVGPRNVVAKHVVESHLAEGFVEKILQYQAQQSINSQDEDRSMESEDDDIPLTPTIFSSDNERYQNCLSEDEDTKDWGEPDDIFNGVVIVKSFQCPNIGCKAEFPNKIVLFQHLTNVHGILPYKCHFMRDKQCHMMFDDR